MHVCVFARRCGLSTAPCLRAAIFVAQAAAVRGWLPAHGASLADLLATDHTTLEATDASQDKRGGGMAALQARLLNMTHDELLLKVGLGAPAEHKTRRAAAEVGYGGQAALALQGWWGTGVVWLCCQVW